MGWGILRMSMRNKFWNVYKLLLICMGCLFLAISGCSKSDDKELLKEGMAQPTEIPDVP